jgi:16S rRNA (uracil1498-N3)-methyltransferase
MTESIPNTHRFFIPPHAIADERVTLHDEALAHQLGRVLRLRPEQRVLMLDGLGTAYVVRLTALERQQVSGIIEQRAPASGEPAVSITLYAGLIRAERFEWILQKGTELGVCRFVPVQCSRSQQAERLNERKLARWQRIVQEAAEQACRGRLPELAAPLAFEDACAQAASSHRALLLWEGSTHADAPTPLLRDVLRQPGPPPAGTSLALLSGPEGGITPQELTTATGHGMIPVSLGPRILRAETAPIAAAAAIFYETGA